MATRNIVKEGDDILLKKCRTVEKFDRKLAELIDDMRLTGMENKSFFRPRKIGRHTLEPNILRRSGWYVFGRELTAATVANNFCRRPLAVLR